MYKNAERFIRLDEKTVILSGFIANPIIMCVVDRAAFEKGERTFPCINTMTSLSSIAYGLNCNESKTIEFIFNERA